MDHRQSRRRFELGITRIGSNGAVSTFAAISAYAMSTDATYVYGFATTAVDRQEGTIFRFAKP